MDVASLPLPVMAMSSPADSVSSTPGMPDVTPVTSPDKPVSAMVSPALPGDPPLPPTAPSSSLTSPLVHSPISRPITIPPAVTAQPLPVSPLAAAATPRAGADAGQLSPVPPAVPTRLRALSSRELKELFKAALERSRPLLQAPSGAPDVEPGLLTDQQKLQFYGYFKQATKGDIPEGDVGVAKGTAVDVAKAEAWRKCKGLNRRDAMRAFVYLMYQVDPGWEDRKTLDTVPEGDSP